MSEAIQSLGQLKVLSEKIHELQVRSEERLKAQHGRFNVFTTLLSSGDEVRLHTRFLHELLNPEGTHDCGNLFLKLFFKTLEDHKPVCQGDKPLEVSWVDCAESVYWVGKEVRKKQGQLDLLLESDTHVLVIENKIWAGEGDRQVARYAEYLETLQGRKTVVLYLTLDGRQAVSHDGNTYFRISYREHIMEWLERCLRETYHIIPINQALIQYRRVVEQLIGQKLEEEAMDTIKTYIRHNPSIIRDHNEVSEAINQLRIDILDEFAEAVIKGLRDEFDVNLRQGMVNESFGQDNNRGLVVVPKKGFARNDHFFEIWIEHNRWYGWAIGIETEFAKKEPVGAEELELLGKRIYPRLRQEYHDAGEHYSEATCTWNGTHWPCSWHNIITGFMYGSEGISKMFEPTHFAEQVSKTVADVRVFVDRFKKIYEDETKAASNPTKLGR